MNGECRPGGRKPWKAFVNGCSISTWNIAPIVAANSRSSPPSKSPGSSPRFLPISGCLPERHPGHRHGLSISSKRPDFTPTTPFNPVPFPSRGSPLAYGRFSPHNSSSSMAHSPPAGPKSPIFGPMPHLIDHSVAFRYSPDPQKMPFSCRVKFRSLGSERSL